MATRVPFAINRTASLHARRGVWCKATAGGQDFNTFRRSKEVHDPYLTL